MVGNGGIHVARRLPAPGRIVAQQGPRTPDLDRPEAPRRLLRSTVKARSHEIQPVATRPTMMFPDERGRRIGTKWKQCFLQFLPDSADFRSGVFGIEIPQRLKEYSMIIP